MTYDPNRHHRRSIRLKGHDYTQAGAYFVTICTHQRACLFGEVVDGVVQLNAFGEIVRDEWLRTAEIRPNVELDAFVIMPNHVHAIVVICRGDPAGRPYHKRSAPANHGPKPDSIGAIVCQFKSVATKRINALRNTPGAPVWQRNYYEHIIRNDESLNRIREYIINNPLQWEMDRENPNMIQGQAQWHAPTKDEPWRI